MIKRTEGLVSGKVWSPGLKRSSAILASQTGGSSPLMLPLAEPQFNLSQGGAATTNPSAGTRGNRTLAPFVVCSRDCRL